MSLCINQSRGYQLLDVPAFSKAGQAGKDYGAAKNLLLSRGCRAFVLLINRPQYAFALDEMKWALSCYRICDEYTFSEIERPIEESEKRINLTG